MSMYHEDTLYSGGWVYHLFRSDIPFIHVLYCFIGTCQFIHLEHYFKGEYAEHQAIGEHHACFPLNFTLVLFSVGYVRRWRHLIVHRT